MVKADQEHLKQHRFASGKTHKAEMPVTGAPLISRALDKAAVEVVNDSFKAKAEKLEQNPLVIILVVVHKHLMYASYVLGLASIPSAPVSTTAFPTTLDGQQGRCQSGDL